MVNTKGRGKGQQQKNYYDKNAVNDNVNAFYESYYQDLENEFQHSHQEEPKQEVSDFKEPMMLKTEKKRKSRFDVGGEQQA
jgi:hypothetical protein